VLQYKGIYKTTHHRVAPLKTGVRLNYMQIRGSYRTGSTAPVFLKTIRLMLFREMVAV